MAKSNYISAPSKRKIIEMLFAALVTLACFAIAWLVFSFVAYSVIYGSLIFAYLLLWDDKTRKEICPHGLWRTIIHDE